MMKKIVLIAIGLVLSIFMLGCVSDGGIGSVSKQQPVAEEVPTDIKLKDINFESEPGSLTMNNLANFDVVIFAGKVESGHLLGGIKAGTSRSFDLTRVSGLVEQKNGAALVRVASYETYSRKARVTEADVLWTGLVVYDFEDSNAKQNINIYAGMDKAQEYFIYVSNESDFVLELRLQNPTGEKLATLAPKSGNKKLWVEPPTDGMPLVIWPTYVQVDSDNNINSFSVTNDAAQEWITPIKDSGGAITITPFKGPGEDFSSIAFKVAYLRLVNATSKGVMLYSGNSTLPDQHGQRNVNSGMSSIYELESTNSEGQSHPGLKYRMPGFESLIPEVAYKPGMEYELVLRDGEEPQLREFGARKISSNTQQLVLE